MLLTRIHLRNFRVYEDDLDLAIPPGLVGIYGPNGSGKSTLLEAIVFALWGKSRTTKENIRSTGVGGDCVAEVEFEHEGHLYLTRRVLRGINSTVSVEVHCDGLVMSTGTRDAERYIESILGMDDASFRASVFAEQKQLAAFSNQSPAERRKLVLQLLGVTPLDSARDAARQDARDVRADHERLRGMLPELATLEVEVDDASAQAAAAEVVAEQERAASEAAERRLATANEAFESLDACRYEHEALVVEGKHAREELDGVMVLVEEQRTEIAALAQAANDLERLESAAAGLDAAEAELEALRSAESAAVTLARCDLPPEPPRPDDVVFETARAALGDAREQAARLAALLEAATAELSRCETLAKRSESLSGEADCPVCGQALGESFQIVQEHRADDLLQAKQRAADIASQLDGARKAASAADEHLARLTKEYESDRAARQEWERAAARRNDADAALRQAWKGVCESSEAGRWPATPPPHVELATEVSCLRLRVQQMREAHQGALRLRGLLERRPALEASLANNEDRAAAIEARVVALREKVRALGFNAAALKEAGASRSEAATAVRAAGVAATEAALRAAREHERAAGAATRLADAKAQHAKLADLESRARHVSRVADLLADFRNTVVASVGPRLSLHAAELFSELTDHEYDALEVDPDTYQLQISDGGRVFGLERFSGSEVDLANLALRVAISEHIHFQSGGAVGLLVLDEVFGPLDEDRKTRMLLALERLRGRFRQVLVVTHDSEIKEQLPHAIEVVKLPGRRATARLMAT